MNLTPNVPLLADSPTRRGETVFLIWDGNPGRFVRHARRPGFWSVNADGVIAETAQKRRLSDTFAEPTTWHRLEFDTDGEARDYADRRTKEGFGSYLGDVDRYLMRVIVEDAAFFPRYPMSRPLRVLCLDIEQRSEGKGFPDRAAPMVSISFCRMGYAHTLAVPYGFVAETGADGEPDDKKLVEAFRDEIERGDPDIIVAYNVGYDLGVIAERAKLHGFPLETWGRLDENSELARSLVRNERKGKFWKEQFYVGGRIVWDLQDNANPVSDYNLSGVKDLKLKTIAAFLGWPVKEEDTKNTLAVWRERPLDLLSYNVNDADLVRRMVERYLPDRVKMAEFFGAPLDTVIDVGSGWPGTVASAQALFQAGIVSDGKNFERHRRFLKTKRELAIDRGTPEDELGVEEEFDDEAQGFIKFQGATVKLHKRGLFVPVHKADFASLYPHVIIAVGGGPENTRLIETEPLGVFNVTREGEAVRLSIPDTNYGHNWLIEVRGKSAFVATMAERMKERLAAKAAGDNTRANILKTQLNAMFGSNGGLSNKYGVWPVAIITAGFSRELIGAAERVVGDAAIETDTDGVYLERPVPVALCERAANRVAEQWGFEPIFKLDSETHLGGWFHEPKQYLILDKKGRLKRYGQAMKGRAHPAIFDHIIERVGGALLRQGRMAALLAARRALDFSNYAAKDFIQRARLNQPIDAYAVETKEVKIARVYEELYGVEPKPGRSYEYVRTRDGNVPPTPEALQKLDEYAYLKRVVLPALSRLGFSDMKELGLEQRLVVAQARSKRPGAEVTLAKYF